MLIEITLNKGDHYIVNVEKILYCYEYKGRMCIELEDGTPLNTSYTRAELVSLFRSFGVLCIDLSNMG